jgi:hypothetical protein
MYLDTPSALIARALMENWQYLYISALRKRCNTPSQVAQAVTTAERMGLRLVGTLNYEERKACHKIGERRLQ